MRKRTIAKMNKAKRAKKMNPVLRGLIAVALVYVAGNMVSTCIKLQLQIKEKQAELNDVQQKISAQTVINEELNSIFNAEIDLEYIEKLARERGYGTPGEIVYENVTDK